MTLQIFPIANTGNPGNASDLGSMPLRAAILLYGHNGEAWRIQTAEGPVYLVLDGMTRKWARRPNGEPRVCFTVFEMARIVDALGPCPVEQPYTFDNWVRPWILVKQEFPMAQIIKIEKEVQL